MMKPSSCGVLLTLCLVCLVCTVGCSGFSSPDAVSDFATQVTGTNYSRQGGMTVGSGALRMARIGVAASGEQSPELLRNLKDVQIGVYRALDPRDNARSLRTDDFARYQPVAALETGGEEIMVLSRGSRGRIRELLILVESDQLLILQVRGNLEGILEQVVRLAFDRADRGDLAPSVVDTLAR